MKPYFILTCPDIRLINAPGIKKGDTRLGPFSWINTAVSAIEFKPPIPDPIITPVRTKSVSFVGFQPASETACSAAATPYKMKSSTLRRSFGSIQASGLKVPPDPSPKETSQAYLVVTRSGSNLEILPAPDWPPSNLIQVSSTPQANGVTKPSPVTTTRRILIPLPKHPKIPNSSTSAL